MERQTLKSLADWMGSASLHSGSYRQVQIDSREVEEGDLFFALKGDKSDGHLYLAEAKARGAVAAVVSKRCEIDLPQILVDDTLVALQKAAKRRLEIEGSKVFGVTGSVGKTTTKDFLATLLQERYRTFSTPKNHNTKLSLPMALLNMPSKMEWLVLEMGMTHTGDIAKLVQIAPPYMALITKIAYAHAVNFSSIEEIARGKAEIFSHTKTKMGIIPNDFPLKEEIAIPWILAQNATRCQGKLYIDGQPFGPFHLPGPHNCHNAALAILAARLVGMEDEEIRRALPNLKLPPQRLEYSTRHGIDFLNDSYNANKASMLGALDSLKEFPHGRKIAVLGEMLELGDLSDSHHEEVGRHAVGCVDALFCYGPKSLPLYRTWEKRGLTAFHFEDKRALGEELKRFSTGGDLILVKASKSNALWTILDQFPKDQE